MPGLRIRHLNGNVRLDSSSRNFLIIGAVTTGQTSSSLEVPSFALYNGEKSYFATSLGSLVDKAPIISISGTTVSWTFPPGNTNLNAPHRIVYGVW